MWALRDYLIREPGLFGRQTQVNGQDARGRYEGLATVAEDEVLLETRQYFYPNGKLRLIGKFEDGIPLREEEWSEDRDRQKITSYGGAGEWLWEKIIDHRTGTEKLWVNRNSFMFSSVPEGLIRSLEIGRFNSFRLFEISVGAREAILEMLGAAKVFLDTLPETIDQLGSNRLLRLDWGKLAGVRGIEPWYFLELHCTTTGKISYIRVPPGSSDIMSAIAWTFGEEKESYRLEVET